jgi:hypothetical protein
LTRDGPDTRPVHVETAYMNVLDPRTGENLWGDSERQGSWFVAEATKDLVDELRELLEADENPAQRQLLLKRHWVSRVAPDSEK